MNTTTKQCTQCKIIKAISLFGNDKRMKDNHNIYCKDCIKTKSREYNKKFKEKRAKYYNDNRESISLKAKIKYKKDGERDREQTRAYNKNNPKKKKEANKNYRKLNRDKIKAYYKNPIVREYYRIYNQNRRALKISTSDDTVNKESLDELLRLQNNKCYHCNCTLDNKKHLDHYIPLSKGGAHSISNVVWSCAHCNLTKNAKLPDQLMLI